MIKNGAIAGIVAGITFAIFEMVAALFLIGPQAFFTPLRMIGAIGLGEQALNPGYPLFQAATVGAIIHMMLSIVYGIVFAVLTTSGRWLQTGGGAVTGATLFGFLLWILNFYILAPALGYTWFVEANPIVQFLAHTFFFGTILGTYLSSTVYYHPTRRHRFAA